MSSTIQSVIFNNNNVNGQFSFKSTKGLANSNNESLTNSINSLVQEGSTITITSSSSSSQITVTNDNKDFLTKVLVTLQPNADSSIVSLLGNPTLEDARKICNLAMSGNGGLLGTEPLYRFLFDFFNKNGDNVYALACKLKLPPPLKHEDFLDSLILFSKELSDFFPNKSNTGTFLSKAITILSQKFTELNPDKAAEAAKYLNDLIPEAEAKGIDVKEAKEALKTSLKIIATNIKNMDNPDEAAQSAKGLAEAIAEAETAGIDVKEAKEALAETLNKIAPNVINLPADEVSEAVTDLGFAIKAARLDPKAIGNAGIMCKLVADGILEPKGNGEFTAGSNSGFPDGTKSQIWLDSKGEFQMEITGEPNGKFIESLKEFKKKINEAFDPAKPIKIDTEALEASLEDTQKALKKNAFIFYDFTGKPPIMFTQKKNILGNFKNSVFSYEGGKWKKMEKPKSDSTASDLPDFTGTSNQHSSQLKISANNVTNVNGNDNDEQLLLKYLQSYRIANSHSSN